MYTIKTLSQYGIKNQIVMTLIVIRLLILMNNNKMNRSILIRFINHKNQTPIKPI